MSLNTELLRNLRQKQIDLRDEDFSKITYPRNQVKYNPDESFNEVQRKIYNTDFNRIKQDKYSNINLKKLLSEQSNIENMDYMAGMRIGGRIGGRVGGQYDCYDSSDDDEFGGAFAQLSDKELQDAFFERIGSLKTFPAYLAKIKAARAKAAIKTTATKTKKSIAKTTATEKKKAAALKRKENAALKKLNKKAVSKDRLKASEARLKKLLLRLKKVTDQHNAITLKYNAEMDKFQKYKDSRSHIKGGLRNMVFDDTDVSRYDRTQYFM
jgi:hypothetical protein